METALLDVAGLIIYYAGYELHSSYASLSNTIVGSAYNRAGGRTIWHDKGLHKAAKTLILYTDQTMETQLDDTIPKWRENKDWLILNSPERLTIFCEAALAILDQDGISLEAPKPQDT